MIDEMLMKIGLILLMAGFALAGIGVVLMFVARTEANLREAYARREAKQAEACGRHSMEARR